VIRPLLHPLRLIALPGWLFPLLLAGRTVAAGSPEVSRHNVVWSSPSTNCWGTMPLGNGDLAANVWVEPSGDVLLFLSKSDAWDAHARLLKIGLLRLRLHPPPNPAGEGFRQELDLHQGELRVSIGRGHARLRIWADAARPVIRLEGRLPTAATVECRLEPWRLSERVLSPTEANGAETFGPREPVVAHPDRFGVGPRDTLTWYHRNERSVWAATLRHQSMEAWIPEGLDPLLHRTFGALVRGDGFRRDGPLVLRGSRPVHRFSLGIHVRTERASEAEAWVEAVQRQADETDAVPPGRARAEHRAWWRGFWERSWVRVTTRDPAQAAEVEAVNRGYVLQRYLNACAGRGAMPIKFNGSLFTVPIPGETDPDYRRWGGCYWFQNTRLPYWPMLASGDLDLMDPLFAMYRAALPLALARTRLHFGHGGAYFAETMHFWGAWHNGEYGWGWERENEPFNRSLNQYIRFHWSGGIELLAMMLDRQAYRPETAFLEHTLLPHADAVLQFYAEHYPRQPDGRILFVPSQALETWWETENPTPEVAGLRFVLGQLLAYPPQSVGGERIQRWQRLLSELPPVPLRTEDGRTRVLPAEAFRTERNMENPELYAVFPFRIYGAGKPGLEIGRETYRRRKHQGNVGWQQDETQAAFLGLAEEAWTRLVDRAGRRHELSRFPAFWGPNFDWIPDQDHGGNLMMALQTMLLQHDGRRILLCPAWPPGLGASFRLHAPGRTVIEGSVAMGKVRGLKVDPPPRRSDVEILPPFL